MKEVGAIKETFFLEWLANTVVVRKKNGKWRLCVDFTDLNRACPKDPFPMPKIDQLVDATYGHPRMSFLDTIRLLWPPRTRRRWHSYLSTLIIITP